MRFDYGAVGAFFLTTKVTKDTKVSKKTYRVLGVLRGE